MTDIDTTDCFESCDGDACDCDCGCGGTEDDCGDDCCNFPGTFHYPIKWILI